MGLLDQIYAMGKPRTSKADVVEAYQQRYTGRGQAGWKQHIIHDLLGMQDITVSSVGKKEYARLAKNMARRFDSGKNSKYKRGLSAPEPHNAKQYEELGKHLPPKAHTGFWLGGTIWVKYSGECVERDIDPPMHISIKTAQRLMNMTQAEMEQAIANAYQADDPEAKIDDKGPNACHPPDFTLTPDEEEEED